jgi:hypothetical protein
MRPRACALLVLVMCVLAGSSARAEPVAFTTGAFVINCMSSGQLCDPPYALAVGDQAAKIRIRKITYDAPEAHCSAGRVLVSLDGQEVARLRYAAARQKVTKRKRLALQPGLPHLFEFRFEGRPGGCNVGTVVSWGGTITLTGRR